MTFSPDVLRLPTSVVIATADAALGTAMEQMLGEAGCSGIQRFDNGRLAWEHVKNAAKIDFIVIEWELAELDGLTLFNRLRHVEHLALVPVVVVSKLLQSRDFDLLAEFPLSQQIPLPLTEMKVEGALTDLLVEGMWYAGSAEAVERALAGLETDPAAAIRTLGSLLANSPAPLPLTLMAARALSRRGDYAAAEALLRARVALFPRVPALLWELARTLYLCGKPHEAKRFLTSAVRISPKNVERLCFAGQVDLVLGDADAARVAFDKCLAIDPEHLPAQSGKLVAKALARFVTHNVGTELPRTLAGVCNLIGVDLAQSGKAVDAVDHYRTALVLIADDPLAYAVVFNLGLAHLRVGDLVEAQKQFERAWSLSKRTFAKAQRLLELTQRMLQAKSSLDLREMAADDDFLEESIARPAKRGASNLPVGGAAA